MGRDSVIGILAAMALIAILGATIIPDASSRISVRAFGAKGDNVTDDSPAFQAAFNACGANHGGVVVDPPTGSMYLLNEGITIPSGCSLEGANGGWDWGAFYSNNPQDWVNNTFGGNIPNGSWLHCNDATNPCLKTVNRAASVGIKGQMFWWTQPTPTINFSPTFAYTWTPNPWPYAIQLNQAMNWTLDNLIMANATNCIDEEGDNISFSSQMSRLSNSMLSCFDIGTNFHYADNYINVSHVAYTNWWFQNSNDVLGYKEGSVSHPGHSIGWTGGFWSAMAGDHIQWTQDAIAMQPTDLTDTSGDTLAADDVMLTDVYFASCQGIAMGASGPATHFDLKLANVLVSTGGIGDQCALATPVEFNINSDNADLSITNLNGYTMQSGFAVGGGGTHGDNAGEAGSLHLSNVTVRLYSSSASGANFITLNTGAKLDMPNSALDFIQPAAGAGVRIVGGTPSNLIGFGSGATIVGNDTAGIVTVGSGPGASGTMTLWTSKLHAPSCSASNYTSNAAMSASASQTQLSITGTMLTNDQIAYQCVPNQ